jgi:TRAP-type C4-dicarboxylate transport system permease small subunit
VRASLMNFILKKILEGLTLIGFTAVIVMMLWGTIDVILQQFGSSLPATIAWTEILNVIAVTLPLAYATFGNVHISIDLVTRRLTGKAKQVSHFIIMIMTFLFMALLSWQLGIQAWRSLMMREFDQLAIKVYYFPAKIALALAFIMAALVSLRRIINEVRGKGEE